MSRKRYNVIRTGLDQAEEFLLEGLTIHEIAQELGCADKLVMYNVARYGLVGSGAGTVEEMRRTERARLERAIQAIWPQVLRGNLEAGKTLLEAERLMVGLCGPDVGRDQAESAEADDAPIRPGAEDARRLDNSTEESPSERLTTRELEEEFGYADKLVAYDVVSYTLVEAAPSTVEKMRRTEGARLEQVIQAAWPRVLRGDLEAIKTLLEALRLKVRWYGLDVSGDRAAAASAGDTFIQVGTGDPNRLENLTEEELPVCIASLERALDDDGPSQRALDSDSSESQAAPVAEDNGEESGA